MTDQLFITFGTQYAREPHPMLIHPDGVVVVEGDTYAEAHRRAFEVTGGQFAFDYPIDRLASLIYQWHPLGVIGRIDDDGYHPIRKFRVVSRSEEIL